MELATKAHEKGARTLMIKLLNLHQEEVRLAHDSPAAKRLLQLLKEREDAMRQIHRLQ